MSELMLFIVGLLLAYVAFVLYAYFHGCKKGNHRSMPYHKLPGCTMTRCWVCGHFDHVYHRGADK